MTREEAVALLERYSNYDGMGIPNLAGSKEAMKVAVDALKEAFPELVESEDERIRKSLLAYIKGESKRLDTKKWIAYLEKQKENAKSADSIPSDCTSEAKYEDRWHKVTDSLPDNGRLVLAKDCLENVLLARYDGENWEVNVYDNEDHYCHNSISKWCEIPSEKQKGQKPAEVDESTKRLNDNWMKQHFDDYKEQKPAEWSEEEKAIIHDGQRIGEGCMGIKGPSCDPGRRGRMGGVPKEISKEAEAYQAQFPAPYDKDDIITAYETAKIKAMEDLPKWKEAKNCGKRECFVGSAFEATGRRYLVLYCYGYGISIEQLFEKLPKEDK